MNSPVERAIGARVTIGGREFVSFAGCDSLGLARHPDVIAAAQEALDRCGVSASASRTTTGTWAEHERLERALAVYMGAEDAVVFPSGWLACQSLVRTLSRDARTIIVDAGAHPGVADAAALAQRPHETYARFDAEAASRALDQHVGGKPLLVSCTVDLAGGTLAPVRDLAQAAGDVAGALVVDDAHGVGVLGENGRGVAEHLGALESHVHIAGTLSKAFGAQGGFVSGTRELCDAVRSAAPAYSGATGLPPAIAAAAKRAVELATDGALRATLRRRCEQARERFASLDLAVPPEPVPWMAVHGVDEEALRRTEAALADAGLLVPYVRYHGAPSQGYLRVALSAAHSETDVDRLADALARVLSA